MVWWKVTQEGCMKVLNYTKQRLLEEQAGLHGANREVANTLRDIIQLVFDITDPPQPPTNPDQQ